MGVVDSLGEGSARFRLGQRVVAAPWNTRRGDGTWQQYAVVDESVLIDVPDSVSDESAAQAVINPVTAYGFLDVSYACAVFWRPCDKSQQSSSPTVWEL